MDVTDAPGLRLMVESMPLVRVISFTGSRSVCFFGVVRQEERRSL
jgi:hypothetical protein